MTPKQKLDRKVKKVLNDTNALPQQKGLIRTVMLRCSHYRGEHPILKAAAQRLNDQPGWQPTMAHARVLKDLLDIIEDEFVQHDGPTSLD